MNRVTEYETEGRQLRAVQARQSSYLSFVDSTVQCVLTHVSSDGAAQNSVWGDFLSCTKHPTTTHLLLLSSVMQSALASAALCGTLRERATDDVTSEGTRSKVRPTCLADTFQDRGCRMSYQKRTADVECHTKNFPNSSS